MKEKLNTNKNLLKARIFEKGFRVSDVADKLGIEPNLLTRKMNKNSFCLKEILSIQHILELSVTDFNNIFFEGGLSFFDDNKKNQ